MSTRSMSSRPSPSTGRTKPARPRDADAARRDILEEATRQFSQKGFDGSRIDEIAENTATSKRMIYYYFESKEGLYLAALEDCYRRIREVETTFDLEDLSPIAALRRIVSFTVDYHAAHTDFIRLVMNENIHEGRYIKQLPSVRSVNKPIIDRLERVCDRGFAEGVFRRRFDPVDLHMWISALAFFNVSNQHTFGYIFDRDFKTPESLRERREAIVEIIERYVTSPNAPALE